MECRICANGVENQEFEVFEMMFGTLDKFVYFRCSVCDCLQIADYPADIGKYYGSTYYSYDPGAGKASLRQRIKWNLRDRYAVSGRGLIGRRLFNASPNKMLAYLAPALRSRKARILDVGCGAGGLLRVLDGIGFHDVVGADPFIDGDIEFGRRGRVLRKVFTEIDGTFDLIIFHHSCEHLPNQRQVFADVSRKLAPGGTCMMGLPLSSSFAWDHYGVNWVQLDAPRHFYLHSQDSLQRLAASADLSIVKTIFNSTTVQFWGSEQYRAGICLNDDRSYSKGGLEHSMFTQEDMDTFARRANELNSERRGDQALFFFKRSCDVREA